MKRRQVDFILQSFESFIDYNKIYQIYLFFKNKGKSFPSILTYLKFLF